MPHRSGQRPAIVEMSACGHSLGRAALGALAALLGVVVVAAAELPVLGAVTPERVEFFEIRIRPLLARECFGCHSAKAEKLKGGLRLDSRAGLLKGGESGPAVVPGNPDGSRLIQGVRYRDQDTAMPPKKRLADPEIADLERWVREGSYWPDDGALAPTVAPLGSSYDWAKFRSGHWAFRPVVKPVSPPVRDLGWPQSVMDRFVLSRLEAAGLGPAPRADRRALIRRASLDLLGLPPTPEEVAAFVDDASPDAFARVVDRLLASPRYGERWGRHWLDVARYSDGFGGFLDSEALPHAWRYRDWVVDALNRDLPYDQFVREQIAGNVRGDNRAGRVGTGFFAIGPTYISDGGDPEAEAQARAETLADRVDTFSRAFLGLTVACARCHDHKFDPITTQDYYALAGVFNNTRAQNVPLASPEVVAAFEAAQSAIQAQERQLNEVTAEIRERQSRALMRECARYLTALRNFHLQPGGLSGEAHARDHGLRPETWKLWDSLLADSNARGRFPGLELWFDQAASGWRSVATESGAELEGAARKFQQRVDGLLDQLVEREATHMQALAAAMSEEARKKVPKPGLGKEDQALLEALRGNPCRIEAQNLPAGADRVRLDALRAELNRLRVAAPPMYPKGQVLTETGTNDMPVAIRGDLRKPGEPAPRRFLQIIAGEAAPRFREGSGLRELAEAVVDPSNPLTARVIVNRVWKHHFGQALVRTPSNLGLLGEKPTHPELLDWLATTLIEDGWSLKQLHRRILLSSTWQMSSRHDDTAFARDGENRLLWRMNPRTLEVESWRDSHLAVTGELDPALGGPPTERILDQPRRTLYATISRNGDRFASDEFFRLFDFPAPRTTSESRSVSTVPQQYLFLLNSGFITARAQALAGRLFHELGADPERIERAYHLLYSRSPTAEESSLGLKYLAAASVDGSRARWESYAQVLLSGHEFRQIQ